MEMQKILVGNTLQESKNAFYKRLTQFLGSLFFVVANLASASPFAYISNQGADTVSVIDLEIDKVVASIPTGKAPVGIAIDDRQNRLYVSTVESRSVSIVDTKHNQLLGEIKLTIARHLAW